MSPKDTQLARTLSGRKPDENQSSNLNSPSAGEEQESHGRQEIVKCIVFFASVFEVDVALGELQTDVCHVVDQ